MRTSVRMTQLEAREAGVLESVLQASAPLPTENLPSEVVAAL
jgi:hypothetical protein